jgi:hypothetical protein
MERDGYGGWEESVAATGVCGWVWPGYVVSARGTEFIRLRLRLVSPVGTLGRLPCLAGWEVMHACVRLVGSTITSGLVRNRVDFFAGATWLHDFLSASHLQNLDKLCFQRATLSGSIVGCSCPATGLEEF